MSEVKIFVNREKELEMLERYYMQCKSKKINCGVLVYGWRRVGKTALLRKFVKKHGGFLIDASWISDPRSFLIYVSKLVGRTESSLKFLSSSMASDLMLIFREGMEILCTGDTFNIIAIDEFHVMLDKISYRIARESGKRKNVVLNDLIWLLREFIESKKCFIILSTSMGWAKLKELYLYERKEASPLTGVLIKLEVEPLDRNSSIELVKKLNPSIDDNEAESIYVLSGGIPRIIEIIAPNFRKNISLLKLVYELTSHGQFDEFFENIIRFIAEATKRDYSVYLEALKAIEDKVVTPEDIGRALNIDRVSIYNVLEELRKMNILEKKKEKGRVKYRLKYPLLSLWLQTKIPPTKPITEILVSNMGMMAESYIKELFMEYLNKNRDIVLYDDKKGTYLAGTADEIRIEIEKIYTRNELKKRLKGIKNGDIIIKDKNNTEWLIEVKATLKDIKVETIEKINRVAEELNIKNKIVIQLGLGGIEPKAIGEAAKTNIVIITREGIKLLAKKIKFMQF